MIEKRRVWTIAIVVLFVVSVVGGIYFFRLRGQLIDQGSSRPGSYIPTPSYPLVDPEPLGTSRSSNPIQEKINPDVQIFQLAGIITEKPFVDDEEMLVFPLSFNQGDDSERGEILLRQIPYTEGGERVVFVTRTETSEKGEQVLTRSTSRKEPIDQAVKFYSEKVGSKLLMDVVHGPNVEVVEMYLNEDLQKKDDCLGECLIYSSTLRKELPKAFDVLDSMIKGTWDYRQETFAPYIISIEVDESS